MLSAAPPWVDGLTIGAVLRQTTQRNPEAEALVFAAIDADGKPAHTPDSIRYRLTYRQLDEEVDRVARSLIALGVRKGEQVAVWATNWPRWVLLQHAAARVGAVFVTVNPAYRSGELSYVLKQSEAKVLFLLDRFRSSNYFELTAKAVPELAESDVGALAAADHPHLRHVVSMCDSNAPGVATWEQFLDGAAAVTEQQLREREHSLDCDEAINIQYTSGTTGFPKGATLTHRNILLNGYYVGQCQKIGPHDRICVPVPFYHCFGCVLGVLCAAAHGAALVIPAEYFDAAATLEAIERERATAIYGVPTMFIAMLEDDSFADRDLTSLRTGIMAGSPCPIEVMNRVVDVMGAREITIAYGLTEASPVITQTRTDDPLELRVGTVGRPIPDIEVKIVDPSTGATLPDERQGELCVRGHVVMLGYFNMPEQTADAIDKEGWLHSGDLAVRMPDGYYRITGRIKEMICRGGENIYPREIEEFLYTLEGVEDVAVVGVPDPKLVEAVAAWIKLTHDAHLTEEEVRSTCRKNMAHFKVPTYIRFVREFPQTVTGKIQKFRIRETMIDELGLTETETA
ncbi:MAG: AMP-binding protein [Planctomycetaceae bacterium]|nr:AMP-binding protein [Planctomycetaceae bacterium]